jgi:hypothetical protein
VCAVGSFTPGNAAETLQSFTHARTDECMYVTAVMEMSWCFTDARDDPRVGVVILTGVLTGWHFEATWHADVVNRAYVTVWFSFIHQQLVAHCLCASTGCLWA